MNAKGSFGSLGSVPKYAGIFLIGCLAVFGGNPETVSADTGMPDESEISSRAVRPLPLDKDAQWIISINYANLNSDSVMIHYRVYEKGLCTEPVLRLMETLRRKLVEKGFMYRKGLDLTAITPNHFTVLLGADTEYLAGEKVWKRKDGNLMVLIMNRNFWARVDINVTDEKQLSPEDINDLADEIMERLEYRSLI